MGVGAGSLCRSISACMADGGWVVSVTFNSCLTVSYKHRGSEPLSFLHGYLFKCFFVFVSVALLRKCRVQVCVPS